MAEREMTSSPGATALQPGATERDNIFLIVLNPMKIFAAIILVCLVLTGTVSAKPAEADLGVSIANPDISSSIYTQLASTACSDDSASVGTPIGMGELDVDSTPDVASVSLDGSPWTYKHCIGGWPEPVCINIPYMTPSTGTVATGSHSITIAHAGYKSYTGTVKICSQKVSYVHKTLTVITTTAPTTTVTTTTTTTASATTATTSAAATTSATTAAPTSATTAATTSATTSSTSAAVPVTTASVAGAVIPAGSGSLSVITTPAGAAVYIDGVQRGVSPATIPGLTAGSHTVLLRLDGYQDLSTPVSITAGTINEFSTGLSKLPAAGAAVPEITTAGAAAVPAQTRSPGFGTAAAACAVGALFLLRRTHH